MKYFKYILQISIPGLDHLTAQVPIRIEMVSGAAALDRSHKAATSCRGPTSRHLTNCQELGCLEVPTLLIPACWYLLPPTSESTAALMRAGNSESRPREDHGTRTVRSIPQIEDRDIHSDHSKPTVLT